MRGCLQKKRVSPSCEALEGSAGRESLPPVDFLLGAARGSVSERWLWAFLDELFLPEGLFTKSVFTCEGHADASRGSNASALPSAHDRIFSQVRKTWRLLRKLQHSKLKPLRQKPLGAKSTYSPIQGTGCCHRNTQNHQNSQCGRKACLDNAAANRSSCQPQVGCPELNSTVSVVRRRASQTALSAAGSHFTRQVD